MESKQAEGKSDFLVGNSLTVAELFTVSLLDIFCGRKTVSETVALANYPKFQASRCELKAMPVVSESHKH